MRFRPGLISTLIFLAQLALQGVAFAVPPTPPACKVIVERILKGEDFTLSGFAEGRVGSMSRAAVLEMSAEEFASVASWIKSEYNVLRGRDFVPNGPEMVGRVLRRPVRLNRNSYLKMVEGPDGIELYGTRYRVVQTPAGNRVLRFDVSESLTRSADGFVAHYASVNVHEVQTNGASQQIGWADFPHQHGRTARWFHVHEARGGQVIGNIPTPGFVKSILPETINWISAAVREGRL